MIITGPNLAMEDLHISSVSLEPILEYIYSNFECKYVNNFAVMKTLENTRGQFLDEADSQSSVTYSEFLADKISVVTYFRNFRHRCLLVCCAS
jgi:hypothetical protein